MENKKSLLVIFILIIIISVYSIVSSNSNPTRSSNETQGYQDEVEINDTPYQLDDDNIMDFLLPPESETYSESSYDSSSAVSVLDKTGSEDQGSLKVCWAFASNNVLEAYLDKKNIGIYNFSENQPEYVSRLFFKDTVGFGNGNSAYNVVKYWFYGLSPITENKFGSYFTYNKNVALNDYLNTNKVEIDVKEVKLFNALNTPMMLNGNYQLSQITGAMNQYNANIKEYIKDNGAVMAVVYTDYLNRDTGLCYDDGTHSNPSYTNSAHAVTLIGWDDDYPTGIYYNNTELKGAWLALNSWGKNMPTFHVAYYDVSVVKSLLGVTKAVKKTWDYAYIDQCTSFDSGNSIIRTYYIGDEQETLETVKVLYNGKGNTIYRPSVKVTVKSSDGTVQTSSAKELEYGLNTFEFNMKVQGTVTVTFSNLKDTNSKMGIFTRKGSTTQKVKVTPEITNDYSNVEGNVLKYKIYTKNTNNYNPENYEVKVYDRTNNDITSKFTITKSDLINNYGNIEVRQNTQISSSKIYIRVKVGGTTGETDTNLVNDYEISNYEIDAKNNVLGIKPSTPVQNFIENIILQGSDSYARLTRNGVPLQYNDYVGTGTKLSIRSNGRNYELTLIIKGDINGDGQVNSSDITSLFTTLKNNSSLSSEYALAADVTNDGKLSLGDIAKMYQYYKGKKNSLE